MERKSAIFGGLAAAAVALVVIFAAILTMPESDAVTVNEFFDDLEDRNGDMIIMQEDAPCNWTSYQVGDNVTIRDRISFIVCRPPENYTCGDNDTVYTSEAFTWVLLNYTGRYEIRPEFLPQTRLEFVLEGDRTGEYEAGDCVTVTVTMIEGIGNSEYFTYDVSGRKSFPAPAG